MADDMDAIDQLELAQSTTPTGRRIPLAPLPTIKMTVGLMRLHVGTQLGSDDGMSFLPHDGGTFQQAPYEAIDRQYVPASKSTDPIDWSNWPTTRQATRRLPRRLANSLRVTRQVRTVSNKSMVGRRPPASALRRGITSNER